MELDFIDNINEFEDHLIRLYNFDRQESLKFRDLILDVIIDKKQKLDLSKIDFIKPRNCNLIMGIYKEDEGILSHDNETFYCLLTLEGYQNMVKLIEPFCQKDTKAYQFLYDIDNPIDFMFTPSGTYDEFD